MWISLSLTIDSSDIYIPKENLLFMKCGCGKRVCWRDTAEMSNLNATCCAVYEAYPTDRQGSMFRIFTKLIDWSNVRKLSVVDR